MTFLKNDSVQITAVFHESHFNLIDGYTQSSDIRANLSLFVRAKSLLVYYRIVIRT